ncbi:MAG: Sec-independent protein translocase protein TatB [Xanthobacteraceae bacterium]
MLELDWGKLVIIGIVALIVIGPKELPAVLRTAGQWMAKVRRMAAEFQSQFQEAMREAEMADLKKQVDQISQTASNLPSHFDPIETARKEIQGAIEGKPAAPPEAASPPAEPMPLNGSSAPTPAPAGQAAPVEPATGPAAQQPAEGELPAAPEPEASGQQPAERELAAGGGDRSA